MKAVKIAKASADKKAKEPIVLELKELSVIADYFVICSGESTTQVKAIAEHIEKSMKDSGVRPLRTEGRGPAHWILMDYGDVIAHIFEDETRNYYELEKLWLDAPRIAFETADRKK